MSELQRFIIITLALLITFIAALAMFIKSCRQVRRARLSRVTDERGEGREDGTQN